LALLSGGLKKMKWISKFVGSPFSGYALIALVVAAAGAGFWFWQELKSFGALEAQAQAQQATIDQQLASLETLRVEADKRQKVNLELTGQLSIMRQSFSVARQRIQNAENNADKVLLECMDMHIADGMQFGPSSDNSDS
jgi:hypothetical protein